jgi:diguanylate cyclase (GGDEF)-like protein
MTSDLMTSYREAEKSSVLLSGVASLLRPFRSRDALEGGAPEMPAPPRGVNPLGPFPFEQFEHYRRDRDGWRRCMSATLALLGHANRVIDTAEQIILEQEERIKRLESLATSDELTGLANRRGFQEAFRRELDRCERKLSNGGLLILIDLDNFKAINDNHGHQAGDACLRLVGKTLQNEVRTMDVAARLGGDEFVLLLVNTGKADASARAQGIAERLNRLSFAWGGDEIRIGASFGLEAYKAGDTGDSIFDAADIDMYASKNRRKLQDGL